MSPELTLMNRVAVMVSECEAFQEWTGMDEEVDPAAAALERVWVECAHKDEFTANGCILQSEGIRIERQGWTHWHTWPKGRVFLVFHGTLTSAGDMTEMLTSFMESIRAIKEEFMTLALDPSYVQFRTVEEMIGPEFDDEELERVTASDAVGTFDLRWGFFCELMGVGDA